MFFQMNGFDNTGFEKDVTDPEGQQSENAPREPLKVNLNHYRY